VTSLIVNYIQWWY